MKQDSVSTAGANDIREVARAFVRVGVPKATFLSVLRKRFGRTTRAELEWLDRVWRAARKETQP